MVFLTMYAFKRRREDPLHASGCGRQKATPPVVDVGDERPVAMGGPVALPVPAADDLAMRKVFDRFDVRAIERARRAGQAPATVAGFLDFARDFVDRRHVAALLDQSDDLEVDRHLAAAVERALLQFELQGLGQTT